MGLDLDKNKALACCFTGHRPEKLPWRSNERDPRCLDLKARLSQAVEEAYDRGFRHFLCGMARGADFYFCEAVLALRARRPEVSLEAVIPFEAQASRWKEPDRNRYFSLIEQCNHETVVQFRYDRDCLLRRDRYLVDHASLLIAVYDGILGGTMYTLAYAARQGMESIILEP